MKIVFLIPPSEAKNLGGKLRSESLSFGFDKPSNITKNVSPKDLHCKDKRFQQAIDLNSALLSHSGDYMSAIDRYSGVMYNAIDYSDMTEGGRDFFEQNFLILSGMYGLVSPDDIIGNYKLPIGTKGLYKFWGYSITQALNKGEPDIIVNLLPQAYAKMIDFDAINAQVIHIAFMRYKDDRLVNMAHGVKKIKGEWIKSICEQSITDYNNFGGDIGEASSKKVLIQIIES